MKTTIKLLAVLILALATFMKHSTASAANIFISRGEIATAYFTSIEGCILTDVVVDGVEHAVRELPSGSDSSSGAFVNISQRDICSDTLLLEAFGGLFDDNVFTISKNRRSATMKATVPAFDLVSFTSLDVSIDVTWTAIGPPTHDRNISTQKVEGCIWNSRIIATYRPAEASGTVSYDGTNLTPEPAHDARFISSQTGDVIIGCGF